jgi:hypothetical protein
MGDSSKFMSDGVRAAIGGNVIFNCAASAANACSDTNAKLIESEADLMEASHDARLCAFIELAKIQESLSIATKIADALAAKLAAKLAEEFQESGTQKVQRNGRVIYLRRDIFPKVISNVPPGADDDLAARITDAAKDELIKALGSDPSTSHLVNLGYNHQTLRSFILRDLEKDELGTPIMPPHLEGKLGVSEVFKVVALKS